MATTTVPANLIQQAWAKDLWKSVEKNLYWNKFTGTGPDSIIQKKTDLSKQAGDKIVVPLMARLISPGVTGDNLLEGNEEPLQFYDFSVTVDQIRNAVRIKGRMEELRTQINLRQAGKDGLATWLQEYLDNDYFVKMAASPTTNRVLYAGSATAENQLTDSDKLTCALISRAKRKALMAGVPVTITVAGTAAVTAGGYTVTGSGTNFDPEVKVGDKITIASQERIVVAVGSDTALTVHAKWDTSATGEAIACKRYLGARSSIRPVKVDGRNLFVMLINPLQGRDLRSDSDWLEAQQYANIRGNDNPIFSGALGMYDGVIVHEHENVPITASGASSANVAHSIMMGCQAGAIAIAQEPSWNEDPTMDYGNSVGFATGMIYGISKAVFNTEDFGCVQIMTGAASE
jgi:hypothetical protein